MREASEEKNKQGDREIEHHLDLERPECAVNFGYRVGLENAGQRRVQEIQEEQVGDDILYPCRGEIIRDGQ